MKMLVMLLKPHNLFAGPSFIGNFGDFQTFFVFTRKPLRKVILRTVGNISLDSTENATLVRNCRGSSPWALLYS